MFSPGPFTRLLSALLLLQNARAALQPVNIPIEVYYNGTELQWYGPIQVGTPPQNFSVVFDTGSYDFLIPFNTCESCSNQRRFDPSLSSTFEDTGDGIYIQFGTGVGVEPVQGDEWVVVTETVKETVTVGGLSAPETIVELITMQSPAFAPDPFDGIVGLAAEQGSFMSSLVQQGLDPLFALHLADHTSSGSQLTLGGIDESKLGKPPTYIHTAFDGMALWTFNTTGISVNGHSLELDPQLKIIFDSGTPNVLFTPNLAEAAYAAMSSEIQPNADFPGAYGVACDRIGSLPAVIDLSFVDAAGAPFNLTIPSSELNIGPFRTDPSQCQTLINAGNQFSPFVVVGASLLKHYYSVWDMGNHRMGFSAYEP